MQYATKPHGGRQVGAYAAMALESREGKDQVKNEGMEEMKVEEEGEEEDYVKCKDEDKEKEASESDSDTVYQEYNDEHLRPVLNCHDYSNHISLRVGNTCIMPITLSLFS